MQGRLSPITTHITEALRPEHEYKTGYEYAIQIPRQSRLMMTKRGSFRNEGIFQTGEIKSRGDWITTPYIAMHTSPAVSVHGEMMNDQVQFF